MASDKLRTSRLLACVDQSGEAHPLLLKARPAPEFNPLKEAVAAQALRQAGALVSGPKGCGPASAPQQIASEVLPLAPAARGDGGAVASALVHYRSAACNLDAWLAAEHSAAHAAGVDAVTPSVAARMFSDAQVRVRVRVWVRVRCSPMRRRPPMPWPALCIWGTVIHCARAANVVGHRRASLRLLCTCTA